MIPSQVIFESPDGGETVYQRPIGGDYNSRTLVSESAQAGWRRKRAIWQDILSNAPNDPNLMTMLEQVEIYYTLKNSP